MFEDLYGERPLFGGAIGSTFPVRFLDVSNVRQAPDHQEVFADPSHDESLIFELLDFKNDVGDDASATWFLQDLATEQDAEGYTLIEQSGVVEAPSLTYRNIPAVVTTAVGQMIIGQTVGEVRAVSDMHQRKAEMACQADAFIALPGGYGTLEELLEVITWAQLGIHRKPVGLLNVDGFYNSLLSFIDKAVDEGFISPTARRIIISAPTAMQLVRQLEVIVGRFQSDMWTG